MTLVSMGVVKQPSLYSECYAFVSKKESACNRCSNTIEQACCACGSERRVKSVKANQYRRTIAC